MTISSTASRIAYAGNGVTVAFSFPYYFLANADLVVILKNDTTGVETVKTITTHYTVAGAGIPAGGTVTMVTAPATGETLTIYRDPAATQSLDLVNNDKLPAEPLEQAIDRNMMVSQRVKDQAARSIRLSEGYAATFDTTLPALLEAGAAIIINEDGDGLEMGPTASDIDDAQANAAAAASSAAAALVSENAAEAAANLVIFGQNLIINQFSGTGAQTAFTLSSDPGNENNTWVFLSGVYISKLNYSVSGTTLTFIGAPPSGTNNIEVIVGNVLSVGTPSDGSVTKTKMEQSTTSFAGEISNFGFSATQGSGAITIAFKDSGGNDASSSSPATIGFRHSTATTGRYVTRTITSAISTVITSGSTGGVPNNIPVYIYVYALDNSGTVEAAWSSYLFDDGMVQSTTAEGGAGGADSPILYSTTARSNVPIRLVGRFKATNNAGAWGSPTEVSVWPFNQQRFGFCGSAFIAGTASSTPTRTNTSLGAFSTDSDMPGPTVEKQLIGQWATTDADKPVFTVNALPPGIYHVIMTAHVGASTGSTISVAVGDGTDIRGAVSSQNVNSVSTTLTINAWFEYTSAGNRSFELYGAASTGDIQLVNNVTTGNATRVSMMLFRYPLNPA